LYNFIFLLISQNFATEQNIIGRACDNLYPACVRMCVNFISYVPFQLSSVTEERNT